MRVINEPQGSPAWKSARLGLPTASNFHRICTPKGNRSNADTKYLAELLSEWFFGEPASDYESQYMTRGTEMEKEAVGWYEWERGIDTEAVGLCLTDDGRAGASPDRLVGKDGCAEIKCHGGVTQFVFWLQGRPEDHWVQRMGQLWVTGREWSDLGCYHPVKQLRTIVRDQRDETFITQLAGHVGLFCDRLDDAKAKLAVAKAEYDAAREVEREQSRADVPAMMS